MKAKTRRFTERSAKATAKWAVAAYNIEDWDVSFSFESDPPSWADSVNDGVIGYCTTWRLTKEAKIWVSPARCKANKISWTRTLLHEMWHVAMADLGIEGPEAGAYMPSHEALWNRLDGILEAAYLSGYKAEK